MKKGIIWLMLSFLLVVALVLVSCAPAVPGEQEEEEEEPVGEQEEEEEEEEEEEPAVGEPQYGGTITYIHWESGSAGIPSLGNVGAPEWLFIAPVMEYMFIADVEKYGPRGSGEFAFNCDAYLSPRWCKGALAESWEVTADKVVFHIRPGVYFTGKSINPGVMKRREYTADDFVNNLEILAFGDGAGGVLLRNIDLVRDVYATDKYTAVVEMKYFHPEWWFWLCGWYETEQYALEVSEEDRQDWGNLVGTGPWILTEETPGSHMAYERNPDYWRTTTINGKEYEIPFADKLVMPFIPDPATAVSALRTGKLDLYNYVAPQYMESLAKTCPELLSAPTTYGDMNVLFLKTDQLPFNNRNVRRALMIGTDRESIHKAVLRIGTTYCWPSAPGTEGHVPLEDLPAETRLLFDYNPDLARQMLRDEGIPEGFKMKIYFEVRHDITPTVSMIAGMWQEELGIEVEPVPCEPIAFESLRDARDYQDAICSDGGVSMGYMGLEGFCRTGAFRNFGNYSDEYFDQQLAEAGRTVDTAKRVAIMEELFVKAIDDVAAIPMSMPSLNCYWWPWLRNYYGEVGGICANPPTASMWIDQAMKAEMGY